MHRNNNRDDTKNNDEDNTRILAYGKWCVDDVPLSPALTREFNKTQLDIVRFLVENGECSPYDISYGIPNCDKGVRFSSSVRSPYTPSSIIKNYPKLVEMGIIKCKVCSGPRRKIILIPTFKCLSVFTLSWKKYEKEEKNNIVMAYVIRVLKKHSDLLIFMKLWDQLCSIVDEKLLFKKVKEVLKLSFYSEYGEARIGIIPPFKAFRLGRYISKSLSIRKQLATILEIKNGKRNENLLSLLCENDMLKRSYIAFLALEDIWRIQAGEISIDEKDRFVSELEYPVLEQPKDETNRLFTSNALKQIFPEYAQEKYVITGYLMYKLMWETS